MLIIMQWLLQFETKKVKYMIVNNFSTSGVTSYRTSLHKTKPLRSAMMYQFFVVRAFLATLYSSHATITLGYDLLTFMPMSRRNYGKFHYK
jgi:hypothetical protein